MAWYRVVECFVEKYGRAAQAGSPCSRARGYYSRGPGTTGELPTPLPPSTSRITPPALRCRPSLSVGPRTLPVRQKSCKHAGLPDPHLEALVPAKREAEDGLADLDGVC